MDESKVLLDRSKTVFIIPFVFSTEYTKCETVLKEKGWLPHKLSSKRHLLEHVSNLIPKDPSNAKNGSIGKTYTLDINVREKYGFPKNTSQSMYLISENKNKQKNSFKVSNIQLYLFETNVGFLTYEITHTSNYINDILLVNYNLKHLNHLHHSYLYSQKEYHEYSRDSSKDIMSLPKQGRTLSEISSKLLESLTVKTYFTNAEEGPDNALVYNFMLFDADFEHESDNKLGEKLFHFRRSYKESYKVSPAEFIIEDNGQILQTFRNSFWGVSLEGLVNIFHLTSDDDVTNDFFRGNYSTDNEKTYFYLYLIALHQRYAFLELNALASELPNKLNNVVNSSELTISDLRKKINFTILRCFFEHVSSVTHQQQVYELIAKNLSLHELKQNLHMELEALASIAEIESSKLEKQKEKEEQNQREKNTNRFLMISTIFVFISTLTGSWTLLPDIFIKNNNPLFNIQAYHALFFIAVLLFILGLASFIYIKKDRKK